MVKYLYMFLLFKNLLEGLPNIETVAIQPEKRAQKTNIENDI